jgi:hypothetical protein
MSAATDERDAQVLKNLAHHGDRFVRPMDLGGMDGSHHSATLARLVKRGLVERKKIHAIYCYNGTPGPDGKLIKGCCCKGHCEYRLAARRSPRKAAP